MSQLSVYTDASSVLKEMIRESKKLQKQPQNEITVDMLTKYQNVGPKTMSLSQMVYDTSYIMSNILTEKSHFDDLDQQSKKNIYKIRDMTLQEAYTRNYYYFLTHIMLFSVFVTLLCLSLGALFKMGLIKSLWSVLTWIIIIALLYTAGMLYALWSLRRRSKRDWNKYMFQPNDTIIETSKNLSRI